MHKATLFVASVGLVVGALTSHASAQSAPVDQRLMFNPNSIQQGPAPQTAKQKPAKPKTATQADTKRAVRPPAPRPAAAPQPTGPSHATVKDLPEQPKIGRIPFETGTLGVTANKQYSNTLFSDGRVTPGFENIQTKDPSYFGFSLSVPTDRQKLLPLPFLSRPD